VAVFDSDSIEYGGLWCA